MLQMKVTDIGRDLIVNRNVETETQKDLYPHTNGLQLAVDTGYRWTIGNEALLGIYLEPIEAENLEATYFAFAQRMRQELELPDLAPATLRPIWNDLVERGYLQVTEINGPS